VPVDYSNPKSGFTTIHYELGSDFSPGKPTIFIIADAQQFYIRKGAIEQLQNSLFDSAFNVVGIIQQTIGHRLHLLLFIRTIIYLSRTIIILLPPLKTKDSTINF
jgi:hypothetical protein